MPTCDTSLLYVHGYVVAYSISYVLLTATINPTGCHFMTCMIYGIDWLLDTSCACERGLYTLTDKITYTLSVKMHLMCHRDLFIVLY